MVITEIRDVLGPKTTLDYTDASKLQYLEMCLKETMRLFAVVPFVFRQTTEDFQLGDLIIPKNVTVGLSIYHAHRDPSHWEKPNEFYPQHFAPEAVTKRHPYAFIPFSGGSRKCLAQIYSYTILKIFLANIVLNYELSSPRKVEDLKLTADITVRPVDGHLFKIRRRYIK